MGKTPKLRLGWQDHPLRRGAGVRRYCGKWKQAVKFGLVELNVGVEETCISRINTGPECKQKTQTLEPLTDTG